MTADPPRRPVILPLVSSVNPEVLVFNVDDIRHLRLHGILGVLIGTLAQYPQQNFYLSVPLRLQIWEVLWLLDRRLAILVDYAKYRHAKPPNHARNEVLLKDGGYVQSNSPNFVMIPNDDANGKQVVRVEKPERSEYVKGNQESHIQEIRKPDLAGADENAADQPSTHQEIPESSSADEDISLALQFEISAAEYLQRLSTKPDFNSNYLSFKYLKDLGYFISPGLKFGGDLVIYPGDPLKFHSYSIVKFGSVDVNDLVVGGRLATGVKKNYVVIDDIDQRRDREQHISNEPKKHVFSIEWAGFG